MSSKHSHCSYCGAAFARDQPWPRRCAGCGAVSFVNPLPVAVLIVPVDDGVLTVRRAVAPQVGALALPGGYIDRDESWQAAAVRELFEETGVRLAADGIEDFLTRSAPDGTLLVFGIAPAQRAELLPSFSPNDEVSERVVVTTPTPLAFPLHTAALAEYFRRGR